MVFYFPFSYYSKSLFFSKEKCEGLLHPFPFMETGLIFPNRASCKRWSNRLGMCLVLRWKSIGGFAKRSEESKSYGARCREGIELGFGEVDSQVPWGSSNGGVEEKISVVREVEGEFSTTFFSKLKAFRECSREIMILGKYSFLPGIVVPSEIGWCETSSFFFALTCCM